MSPHLPLSERDIERLLEGRVPPGRGDLAEVARALARLREGAAGEPIPPMGARLLAQLDEAAPGVRLPFRHERAAEQRRVRQGRRRWRGAIAAAAAIAVLGGAVIAAVRGPLGDDLRTRPGDESVSVAEPGGSSSTLIDDESAGGVESAAPGETTPDFSPGSEDEAGAGDLGVPGEGSGGVVTTEVPEQEPPPQTSSPDGAGAVDWDEVADDCAGDTNCVIDAADESCGEGDVECWEAAADACDGNDPGCRYALSNLCGDTDECRQATFWSDPPRDHWP